MTKPNAVTRGTISLLPDHLLDIEEAAAFLNCCRATVRREVARGRLRAQKVGQRWRFAPEDLLAYLDSETAASAAERTEWDAYIRKVVAAAPPLTPEQTAALIPYSRGGSSLVAENIQLMCARHNLAKHDKIQ